MMKRFFLAAAVAASMILPASAADNAKSHRPVYAQPAPYNWTGFYLGGHLGYGWGASNYDVVLDGFGTVATGSVNAAGAFGGLHAGYNWQSGRFVYGPEIQYTWSGIKASGDFFGVPISSGMSSSAAIYGKLGYLVDTRFLVYIGIGATMGNFKTEIVGLEDWTQSKVGGTAIVGADYLLSRNWVVGTRYTYENYGKMTHEFASIPGLSTEVNGTVSKLDLRVSYLF